MIDDWKTFYSDALSRMKTSRHAGLCMIQLAALSAFMFLLLAPNRLFANTFATIINDPPTTIGNSQTIGANTQLNLFAGGTVGSRVIAGPNDLVTDNIEVNIYGGAIANEFRAGAGAIVNMFGGTIGGDSNTTGGSTFNLHSGVIGGHFVVSVLRPGGILNMSGGSIVDLGAFPGAKVNISGGVIGNGFGTSEVGNMGATIDISGGSIGDVTLNPFSAMRMSGGEIRNHFDIFADSTADILGGKFPTVFHEFARSRVNLLGRAFAVAGVPLSLPSSGQPFIITQRDVTLSGTLVDGSQFNLNLKSDFPTSNSMSYFSPDAILTVALVPEPTSLLLSLLALVGLCAVRRSRYSSQSRHNASIALIAS